MAIVEGVRTSTSRASLMSSTSTIQRESNWENESKSVIASSRSCSAAESRLEIWVSMSTVIPSCWCKVMLFRASNGWPFEEVFGQVCRTMDFVNRVLTQVNG